MSDLSRGLPLLSGPPPPNESSNAEIACRKCNKEFNMIFARARKCNHCGYSYCHSCTDYQALMPRSGAEMGYDAMNVCAFCIELLTITAAGRHQLKTMSLAKLKKYTTAYNIKIDRAVEKDDLIDAILAARGPNGCLSRANENYYRKYSVPNRTPQPQGRSRGFFSSRQQQQGQGSNAPPPPPVPPRSGPIPEFARPDLAPDGPPPPVPPRTGPMPEFPRPDLASDRPSHPQSYPQSTYPPRPPPGPPPQQQQQQYSAPPYPPPPPHPAYTNSPPHNPPPQFHTPPPRPPPANPSHGYGGYPGQAYHQNYPGSQRTQAHTPPPPPPPQYSRPQPQQPPPQNYQTRPTPPRPTNQRPPQPPPQAQAQPSQPPPRPRAASTPPPPNLDMLVTMSEIAIGSLSISTLKSILFTNHVNAGQILEKSDLVKKVLTLVEDEKADRERQRQAEMREEMERVQREMEREAEMDRQAEEREEAERVRQGEDGERRRDDSASDEMNADGSDERGSHAAGNHASSTPSSPPKATAPVPPPKTQGSASTLERTGLCVICQDEEANIAIVDCGHMAMCRGCSDLVMASSRECPLCRTRIVTEARLLRIFKT